MKKDNAMKDKKKIEVLLRIIKRIYDQNPEMQEAIDVLIVEVCTEEDVSFEQLFFILLFFVFIIMAILENIY